MHVDKLKLVFPLQNHWVKTIFWTLQRKISHRKAHHACVFLTELRLKHNRFTEGGEKTQMPAQFDWGWRDACAGRPAQPHETRLDLLTPSWELSLRPFPFSIKSWQGSHRPRASNRSYWPKHICTKHYETRCWESFKQLIFCSCSLHGSPTCTQTCWSQDVANKSRAQLNIHFPRHLLLPIPFLLFSTPLTSRTHCRCFDFVCFEVL